MNEDEQRISELMEILKLIYEKEKQVKREIKALIDKKLKPGY